MKAWRAVRSRSRPAEPDPYCHAEATPRRSANEPRVSALIPTLDRYPYLRVLLENLRAQTIRPYEVIIVDQTAIERRDTTVERDFADLPLKVLYLDQPGQCSSRNAGLVLSTGDDIVFLDDDEELQPTFLAKHLQNLDAFGCGSSCGVIDEVGAGPLPENFTFVRASDVFPAGNTMVERDVLHRAGLFDLAYERGQRADGDLGMRVYLSGELTVMSPEIRVLHHHASRGGLRAHKARIVTYAASRKQLKQRHLPSISEIYLAMRYFTPRQVHEMLWLSAFGTASIRGSRSQRVLKALVSSVYMPNTVWELRKRLRRAEQMLGDFPQIASLSELRVESEELICA